MTVAAGGAATLAGREAALTATTEIMMGVLARVDAPLLAMKLALGALAADLGFATLAVRTFAHEAEQLFHTQELFRNLGVAIPLTQFREFSSELSRLTGINRAELEGLGQVLAQAGVPGGQLESLMQTIANVARGSGDSVHEVATAVEGAVEGHMRQLRRYGIVLEDTGSRVANLNRIQQQLNLRFQGAGADFADTLPGALDRFQESLRQFLSGFGERIAPALIAVFNALADAIFYLVDHMDTLINILNFYLALIHLPSIPNTGGAAAQFGRQERLATENTALRIADNTGRIMDAIESGVFGGPGTRVKEAFTYRDHALAFSMGRPNFARR